MSTDIPKILPGTTDGLDSADSINSIIDYLKEPPRAFIISVESDESVSLKRGTPVSLVANKLRRASSESPYHSFVGLVYDDEINPGSTGLVQTSGVISQPALEWATITGNPAGLSPNSRHFLSETGELSVYPPTNDGQYLAPVGYAINFTEFVILKETQVLL